LKKKLFWIIHLRKCYSGLAYEPSTLGGLKHHMMRC